MQRSLPPRPCASALLDRLALTEATLVGHSMGGGEIARYLTRHGGQRIAQIVLVSSTVPNLDADPQMVAESLDRIRSSYGQWVAENAAASFGDGLAGCAIPQLDKDQTIRDWMGVSLLAAVSCLAANMRADFTAKLSKITLPALILHGDHDPFAPLETYSAAAIPRHPRSAVTARAHSVSAPMTC